MKDKELYLYLHEIGKIHEEISELENRIKLFLLDTMRTHFSTEEKKKNSRKIERYREKVDIILGEWQKKMDSDIQNDAVLRYMEDEYRRVRRNTANWLNAAMLFTCAF